MPGSTINMLWVRGDLPWYAIASIQSFLRVGHSVHLYHYGRISNIPPGCVERDASEVLDESRIFSYSAGSMKGHLSGFADWFRYELLLKEGGWWSDIDVIALKPFTTQSPYLFASGWEPTVPRYVNNNVIYVAEQNSELMRACVGVCRERGADVEHCETGPVLLHKLVQEMSLNDYVSDPQIFNPIHYGDLRLLVTTRARLRVIALSRRIRNLRPIFLGRGSKAVHLYAALLQKALTLDTVMDIPSGSYLAEVLRVSGS